jgi:hypothetical protein
MSATYNEFASILIGRGWKHEDVYLPGGCKQNEKALVIGDYRYPTFQHPTMPVKIALSANPLSIWKGSVYTITSWGSKLRSVTVTGIVSEERKKGYGDRAMRELLAAADEADCFLMIEPAPISRFKIKGQRMITRQRLVKWYRRLGFVPSYDNDDLVLHYPNKPLKGD